MKRVAVWLNASSMYDPAEHAPRAYNAYGDHAGWVNYRGDPMPQWHELGEQIRGHWIAATAALLGEQDL